MTSIIKCINLVCPLAPAGTANCVDSVVQANDGHLNTTHARAKKKEKKRKQQQTHAHTAC